MLHLTPRVGWMNDPNGVSYYNGEYHLFYQYHPYSTYWGPMHWGHAVSRDLLHWRYLPAAMAPDTESDRDGCFSGCALTLPDGRQELIYTGVVNKKQKDGSIRGIQTQCAAVGDGVEYEKLPSNPILSEEDLPGYVSGYDFRDPKAWREPDGTYRMLCAARSRDGSDTMFLMFQSPDALHWTFDRKLIANSDLKEPVGRMFECPDFFPLDGKQVLLASSQDMQGISGHACGNGAFCLIGTYDRKTEQFIPEAEQNVDCGIDFYAAQTIDSPDGRRIMIGWMQNWDTVSSQPDHCRWFGQTTIPRELSIRNGRLLQRPIRELDALRLEPVLHSAVPVHGKGGSSQEIELAGVRGRCVDLEVSVSQEEGSESCSKFVIRFAADEKYHTDLIYRPAEHLLTLDRTGCGSRRAVANLCSTPVHCENRKLRVRILLDRFSAEVFVNDGEEVMSVTFYTPIQADHIRFSAIGAARMDVAMYPLRTF